MPDRAFFRRQTLKNYDYTWNRLKGDPDVRSEFWQKNVSQFLVQQELCIAPEWFVGRKVLDVGCGGGRWTFGFQELGCEVTAVDASASAVDFVRNEVANDKTKVYHSDLFELPDEVTRDSYDLVFSWGVLHHTGDTYRALQTITELVKPDGTLYIYLYGRKSWSPIKQLLVKLTRTLLLPVPPVLKFSLFKFLLGEYKAGLAMDVFGATIAHRYSQEQVDTWLEQIGYQNIVRTISTDEIYRKASNEGASALGYALEPSEGPYWFEEWRKENYENLLRRDTYDPGQ
ncbi:MAG: class I SAM-dependent methyltransferase [Candidatus Latescibacterota bacterium]|nr:class I SAM-dependent methyltransferase [Candidatus Latescibacterota bacterium]